MRVDVLGVPVDALDLEGTVVLVRDAIISRRMTRQVSLNVAKLVKMRTDNVLREDVLSSDIISADGMGIVLASRLIGSELVSRVPGIDLMEAVLTLCAKEGFRVYFLGASTDVINRAAAVAIERHPGLVIVGMRDGYFQASEEQAVTQAIRSTKPDCLFIGMPTPQKERLLSRFGIELNVPFTMGVGGSFDVLVGKVARAPLWMQRTGFEWFYRLWQEPRRLWWRYTSTNSLFAYLLAVAILKSLWNRSSPQTCRKKNDAE